MTQSTPESSPPPKPRTLNARTMSPRQLEEVRQNLFNRPAPSDYLAEWEERVAPPTPAPACDQISLVLFKVAGLWLGADVSILVEITEPRPIHRLPHRTNSIFLGVVNIRGQLRLCGSLSGLMKLEEQPQENSTPASDRNHVFPRMLVLAEPRGPWVFPVDEVAGVVRFSPSEVGPAPVTVTRGYNALTRGVIQWNDKQVAFIDHALLFSALNRSLT